MDKSSEDNIIIEPSPQDTKCKQGKHLLKAPVSVLAIIQLMLATDQILESTVIMLLDRNAFYHQDSRWGVQLMIVVTLVWLLLTLLLLLGLFTSKPWLIFSHFLFTTCLCPLKMTVLAIMSHSSASWYPIFRTSFTLVILLISLVYEWRCFKEMRYQRRHPADLEDFHHQPSSRV